MTLINGYIVQNVHSCVDETKQLKMILPVPTGQDSLPLEPNKPVTLQTRTILINAKRFQSCTLQSPAIVNYIN